MTTREERDPLRPAATSTRPSGATASSLEVRPRDGVPREQLPPLLQNGPVRIADLDARAAGDANAILDLYTRLHAFADAGLVTFAAGSGATCLGELRPMAPGFRLMSLPSRRIALSRFAHVRVDGVALSVQTPLGVGAIRILHPAALRAFGDLAAGAETATLIAGAERPADMYAFLELLVSNLVAGAAGADGAAHQDGSTTLRHWEFHDLVFHWRSRLGRHDGRMGATFRMHGQLEPIPAVPELARPVNIPLARPTHRPPLDADLVNLLSRRTSVREHGQVPITVREVGDFLFHTARVLDVVPGPQGPFTRRPYPNGGASYELEFYLVADRCLGLTPGFYYYDAAQHGLAGITAPNADTEALLAAAFTAAGDTVRPQVLLVIASRFQRVSWKYEGIAYATTLKNLGALYATMYLVATAMGLAPCALGIGDPEPFCRLAGTDRYAEASVGEFMIGSRG